MEIQAYESASTVFATPELVERIILHLPLLDQFVTMRVNSLCRDIVQTVVVIRRKMQLVHARHATKSSLERRTETHPTRFFLGNSSALFETSPFFLSGLGSLFYGITHRGLYKGCAVSSNGKCSLHLDIAPFYFTGIHQASDADFRHIEIMFRWRPSEPWLEGRRVSTTCVSKVDGKLLPVALRGSWENMVISPVALPVKITVMITTPLGYSLFSPWRQACHENRFLTQTEPFHLVLQPKVATLGGMTSFLRTLEAEALRCGRYGSRTILDSTRLKAISGHCHGIRRQVQSSVTHVRIQSNQSPR
jgi:hypothetical protein